MKFGQSSRKSMAISVDSMVSLLYEKSVIDLQIQQLGHGDR